MFIPAKLYQQIIKYTKIPTVDFIFLDSNKNILLWLRNNAPLQWTYYLPGWRMHKNETILQAAKRKAKEEVSVSIDISKLQFVWIYDDNFQDSMFQWVSSDFLACIFVYHLKDIDKDSINEDKQHSEFKFFSYDDPDLHPFLLQRLQKIQSEYNIFEKN
jgi:colanic acid biosynthesis protein WcaH